MMNSLRVRPYKPDDYLNIETLPGEREAREDQPVEYFARYHMIAGPAMSLVDENDKIIACAGMTILWPGTAEAWIVLSKDVAKYVDIAGDVLFAIKNGLETVKKRHGLKRIHALVNPKIDGAARVAEHFGFEFEASLRRYGPKGVDKDMYAWTEEAK